jgi:hypothetical protein
MSIELIRILQFSFCFLVATKCSESAFPTHSYGFLSELIQFIREERCEEETETPHHLPGRANAHSTWGLGPATAGLRFRRRLLRKAQYARPRSMSALAGPWSHSHILAGVRSGTVLSCPWMSTMARRRARGAEDGTCSALLHHVAAVRRRTLAMSTANSDGQAPAVAHQYRGAVISCAARTNAQL